MLWAEGGCAVQGVMTMSDAMLIPPPMMGTGSMAPPALPVQVRHFLCYSPSAEVVIGSDIVTHHSPSTHVFTCATRYTVLTHRFWAH